LFFRQLVTKDIHKYIIHAVSPNRLTPLSVCLRGH
jgi:hypothetical protein